MNEFDDDDGPFPEFVLKFIDTNDLVPLPGKIVLALLKLYPDLAYINSPVPGQYEVLSETLEKPEPVARPKPFRPCALCGIQTTHRFFLTKKISFVLCTVHAETAEILVLFNKRFFTRDNFIYHLWIEVTKFDELLSSV